MTEISTWLCVTFGLCIFGSDINSNSNSDPFQTVYEWSQLEFDYATEKDRQADIEDGTFTPGKIAPADVDVYHKDNNHKIFVTIPRLSTGIPATLGRVLNKKLNNNPLIEPYPSWSWHRNLTSCKPDRLLSVFRVQIDECQRLWVLDAGQSEADKLVCPPQIIAFDLKTNKVRHRYEIPADQFNSSSTFVTPIVDVRDPYESCSNTFVYAADCTTFALVVYDVQRNTSWRITDKTMYPDPAYYNIDILGTVATWTDGILGMTLSPYKFGEDRILYYHAMSNDKENWVYTSNLRNQRRFVSNSASSPEIFHTFSHERYTQSAAEAIDKHGIMYFGLMNNVTINCWNTRCTYETKNFAVVGNNKTELQFASGVKIINCNLLFVMTSRLQKMSTGTLDSKEINFRILTLNTNYLEQCKTCAR